MGYHRNRVIDGVQIRVVRGDDIWNEWNSVSIERSLDALTGKFTLQAPANADEELQANDIIGFWAGDTKLMTGRVEKIVTRQTRDASMRTYSGRGLLADLVDVSGGNLYQSVPIERQESAGADVVIQSEDKPLRADWRAEQQDSLGVNTPRPFYEIVGIITQMAGVQLAEGQDDIPIVGHRTTEVRADGRSIESVNAIGARKIQVTPPQWKQGETAAQMLHRAAASVQVTFYETPDGELAFFLPDPDRKTQYLLNHEGIAEITQTLDFSNLFYKYIVKGSSVFNFAGGQGIAYDGGDDSRIIERSATTERVGGDDTEEIAETTNESRPPETARIRENRVNVYVAKNQRRAKTTHTLAAWRAKKPPPKC